MRDLVAAMFKQKAAKKKRVTSKRFTFTESEFSALLEIYGAAVVGFTLQELNGKNLPSFFDPLEVFSRDEVRKIVRITNLWLGSYILENVRKKNEDYLKQLEQSKREAGNFPLLILWEKYAPPQPAKKGSKPDSWGSFFLVALTEHLHQKIGKYRYAEASRLLTAIRVSSPALKARTGPARQIRHARQTALVRVRQFKRTNLDWEDGLNLLTMQYPQSLFARYTRSQSAAVES